MNKLWEEFKKEAELDLQSLVPKETLNKSFWNFRSFPSCFCCFHTVLRNFTMWIGVSELKSHSREPGRRRPKTLEIYLCSDILIWTIESVAKNVYKHIPENISTPSNDAIEEY